MQGFADYEKDKWKWITPFDVGFYPDHFPTALAHYTPIIDKFRMMAAKASSSVELLRTIQQDKTKGRIQLLRIFRRYVCPIVSIEVMGKKKHTENVITAFSPLFREIKQVRANIAKKEYDLIISAILYEHKDRGKLGYILEGKFFHWFKGKFALPPYELLGPGGPGPDVELDTIFSDYPHFCPCDMVIKKDGKPLVVGFARYDSARGGSQEDDRTGGNQTKVIQILAYANENKIPLKILFLNDGPGLLAGSMWRDYGEIEKSASRKVMVATLKMLDARFTEKWMLSR